MKKQSKRALTLALNRAATAALAGNLASLKYGGHTTPGPRQTSILVQLADAGRATPVRQVAEAQGIPVRDAGVALTCLRLRGLVRRRGEAFALTVRGAEAVRALHGLNVPAGVGLVLTGHAIRKA